MNHRSASSTACRELTDLFILRGREMPAFIRSDNVPEFVAEAVRDWISAAMVQRPLFFTASSFRDRHGERQ